MKYIDSEKLISEIENKWRELADKNVKAGGNKYDGEISAYLSVKNLITSLQQEMELPEKYQTPDWLFKEEQQYVDLDNRK